MTPTDEALALDPLRDTDNGVKSHRPPLASGLIPIVVSLSRPKDPVLRGPVAGGHTMVIRVLGQKNSSFAGTDVVDDGFVAYP